MAIREVSKAHIACSSSDSPRIFEALQNWGLLEIFSGKDFLEDNTGHLRKLLTRLEFISSYIKDYEEKPSAFKRLREGPPKISPNQLAAIIKETDIDGDYEEIRSLGRKLLNLKERIDDAFRRQESLELIKSVSLKKESLSTIKTRFLIAFVSEKEAIALKDEDIFYVEEISREFPAVSGIGFHIEDEKEALARLDKLNLNILELPSGRTPSEEIANLDKIIADSRKEIEEIKNNIREKYVKKSFNYLVLLDYYENIIRREGVASQALSTDYACIISGWCPDDARENLEKFLEELDIPFHVEFEKASPEDDPPVLLKNDPFSESFELVTDLYGTPGYSGIDPTPHLSFFFAFFFGLCLGDAGYGLILVALALGSIYFLKISYAIKNFMKLVLFSGFFAVLAGILSGGWFGDALQGVGFFERLRIIDLMDSPEYFLYFSIGLGFVQVVYGQIIAGLMKVRRGDVKAFVYEDISRILFVVGVSLFIVNSLAARSDTMGTVSVYLFAAGICGILFFSGHKAKNIFLRPLKGLGNLYGMTDYFKDMVSYSRIFALGMATAILGMAINEISRQLPGMLGILSYAVIPFVLIGGHLVINLLMSSLSGYVHTSRLQYVEFFTKFFEGGGRRFTPFRRVDKRVNFAGK